MRKTRLAAIAASVALVGLPLAAGPAIADDHGGELTAELSQLNDSGASGTAWAKVDGTNVEISLETQGLLDGAPHAQASDDSHGNFTCDFLFWVEGGWSVIDLGSANGTYVAGRGEAVPAEPLRRGERRWLADGDRIYVGGSTCFTARAVTANVR